MATTYVSCPGCGRDADMLIRKDGTIRKHRKPSPIPGGLAAADCVGAGQKPVATPVPAWIAAAFHKEV